MCCVCIKKAGVHVPCMYACHDWRVRLLRLREIAILLSINKLLYGDIWKLYVNVFGLCSVWSETHLCIAFYVYLVDVEHWTQQCAICICICMCMRWRWAPQHLFNYINLNIYMLDCSEHLGFQFLCSSPEITVKNIPSHFLITLIFNNRVMRRIETNELTV